MTIVQGWDIALNHGAVVELEDGDLKDFFYWTTTAGAANRSKSHGSRLVLLNTEDKQLKSVSRLSWIKSFLETRALNEMPDYVGIEDYAIRAEQGAHYMGEVGGVARLLCWGNHVRFRLHDPISVKMFGAHDGTCQKDSIERAVKSRWGVDFSEYNQPMSKPTAKNVRPRQVRTTSEDLADAFVIAKMVHFEVLLRSGNAALKDMHPKEIQVFNRVTKTYPVNLLNREWVFNDSEEQCFKRQKVKFKEQEQDIQGKSKVVLVKR